MKVKGESGPRKPDPPFFALQLSRELMAGSVLSGFFV
jgi:hypothetical protein